VLDERGTAVSNFQLPGLQWSGFRICVAIVVGAALMFLAMRGVDLGEAWGVVSNVRWPQLTVAMACVVASPWIRGLRWKELFESRSGRMLVRHEEVLLEQEAVLIRSKGMPAWLEGDPQGGVPSLTALTAAVSVGQTLNFVVPFRSGDVARVLMVGGKKLQVAGTIAVEKFLDAIFFGAICLLLPLVWVMPDWLKATRASVIVLSGVYLLVVAALAVVLPRVASWSGIGLRIAQIVRIPPIEKVPVLFGTTLVLWTSGLVVNYFVLQALHIEASLVMAVVLLVILQAGVAVPSTPGKVGVFQYLAVLGLSLFGVEKAPALAFGLVLHLVVFVPVAIIAGVFWVADRRSQ